MKKPMATMLLVLAGCGSDNSQPPPRVDAEAAAASDAPSRPGGDFSTGVQLPPVGRRITLTLAAGGEFDGQTAFDVAEVIGLRVRLRYALCDYEDPGVWVDWETVLAWEDLGRAIGDDRNLGLPVGFDRDSDENLGLPIRYDRDSDE